MFADGYNRGKHFKHFSSSLFQCVMASGNKAYFTLCLTVLGTSKATYIFPSMLCKTGFSGFPPSSRINISKFRLDREIEGHGFVSRRLLCATLVKQSQFILFLFIYRGYYTVARRYEFYFQVAKQYFTNERSE